MSFDGAINSQAFNEIPFAGGPIIPDITLPVGLRETPAEGWINGAALNVLEFNGGAMGSGAASAYRGRVIIVWPEPRVHRVIKDRLR